MSDTMITFKRAVNLALTDSSNSKYVPYKDGMLSFATDTGNLYIDCNNKRIEITDVITLETESNRTSILAPITNKFYFVKATNLLYRYDGSSWITINDVSSIITRLNNLENNDMTIKGIKNFADGIKIANKIKIEYDSETDTINITPITS